MPLHLPNEILLHILEYAQDDFSTLHSLLYVNKFFFHATLPWYIRGDPFKVKPEKVAYYGQKVAGRIPSRVEKDMTGLMVLLLASALHFHRRRQQILPREERKKTEDSKSEAVVQGDLLEKFDLELADQSLLSRYPLLMDLVTADEQNNQGTTPREMMMTFDYSILLTDIKGSFQPHSNGNRPPHRNRITFWHFIRQHHIPWFMRRGERPPLGGFRERFYLRAIKPPKSSLLSLPIPEHHSLDQQRNGPYEQQIQHQLHRFFLDRNAEQVQQLVWSIPTSNDGHDIGRSKLASRFERLSTLTILWCRITPPSSGSLQDITKFLNELRDRFPHKFQPLSSTPKSSPLSSSSLFSSSLSGDSSKRILSASAAESAVLTVHFRDDWPHAPYENILRTSDKSRIPYDEQLVMIQRVLKPYAEAKMLIYKTLSYPRVINASGILEFYEQVTADNEPSTLVAPHENGNEGRDKEKDNNRDFTLPSMQLVQLEKLVDDDHVRARFEPQSAAMAQAQKIFFERVPNLRVMKLHIGSRVDMFSWIVDRKHQQQQQQQFQSTSASLAPIICPKLEKLHLTTWFQTHDVLAVGNSALAAFSESLRTFKLKGHQSFFDYTFRNPDWILKRTRPECNSFGDFPFLLPLLTKIKIDVYIFHGLRHIGAFDQCPALESLTIEMGGVLDRQRDLDHHSVLLTLPTLAEEDQPGWDLFPRWRMPRLKELILHGSAALRFDYDSLESMKSLRVLTLRARTVTALTCYLDRIPRLSTYLYPNFDQQHDSEDQDQERDQDQSRGQDRRPNGNHHSINRRPTYVNGEPWTGIWDLSMLNTLELMGPPALVFDFRSLACMPRLESLTLELNTVCRPLNVASTVFPMGRLMDKDRAYRSDLKTVAILGSWTISRPDMDALLTLVCGPNLELLCLSHDGSGTDALEELSQRYPKGYIPSSSSMSTLVPTTSLSAPVPAKCEEDSYSSYETIQIIFDCLDGTQDRENFVKRVREDIPFPGLCASLKLLTMGSTISEKDQGRLGLIALTADEINFGFYFKRNLRNKDRRPVCLFSMKEGEYAVRVKDHVPPPEAVKTATE